MTYMDEVADEFGVKPDVWKLFKEDFRLGWQVRRSALEFRISDVTEAS